MRILILGKNGQVAWELQRSCIKIGEVKAVGQSEADFLSPDKVLHVISEYKPTHIVNAAAYTAVDLAEREASVANQINGTTVGEIADLAKRLGAHLIHYSTDYVFDGVKKGAYVETDSPSPLNVYGQSKLLGEKLIQEVGGAAAIVRVSWVYGRRGKNFYRTMLRLGYERNELKVVDDQVGAPTWCRDIAEATVHMLADRNLMDKSGIYHLSPQGETSWYGFAKEIFETERKLHPESEGRLAKVLSIASAEYPSPVRRPQNSKMSAEKFEKIFKYSLGSWEGSLHRMMAEPDTESNL